MTSVVWQNSYSQTGTASTWTFNGVAFGDSPVGDQTRHVLVAFAATQQGSADPDLLSVTIGGVAADVHLVVDGGIDLGANRMITGYASAEVPAGTVGSVVVVSANATFDGNLGSWAAYDIDPASVLTASDSHGNANPHNAALPVNVPAGGILIGAFAGFPLDPGEIDWTGGPTERSEVLTFVNNRYSWADYTAVGAQTPLAAGVTIGAGALTMSAGVLSFAPVGEGPGPEPEPDIEPGPWRPSLVAFLLADAAISAAVGGTRVYPVTLPQEEFRRSIVYSMVDDIGDHHMEGPSGLARPRMRLDCLAPSIDDAVALAGLVKARMDGFQGIMPLDTSPPTGVTVQGVFFDTARDDYQPESKLYVASTDYLCWIEEL